jgi:two-component system, OmpR family, phosphate regulon sensor histidine kinase PhoR
VRHKLLSNYSMKIKRGFFDGWILALGISIGIALLTLTLCLVLTDIEQRFLFPLFVIVSIVSFIFILALMEFSVKRVANQVYHLIEKKKRKNENRFEFGKPGSVKVNPMDRLHFDLKTFVSSKENEIEELKKSEVFRREFVANVSHELKTPLFAAQGFIHTLIDGAAEDEKVRTRFLNKAAKSLDGLEILVQDLLMLSQIETGEIKMKIEPQDLNALCHEVIEEFEESAHKKQVRLKIEEPKKKAIALADAKWIRQVMINLISNAIQHTPEDGNVTVKFDISKKTIEVMVKDTGAGIRPEHLPRIFERFYRVDKSRSRDHGGTGLGLAIVKHILEGHRTKAEVKSEIGRGSEFSFVLERVRGEE